MTAVFDRLDSLDREQRSVLSVVAVTLVALLIGWMLKTAIQNQTRLITQNNITAEVPAHWVAGTLNNGADFRAWNGRDHNQQYMVTLYPTSADVTIGTVVIQRNLNRGQALSNYRVLDEFSQGVVNGAQVYEANFAYVKPGGRTDLPEVIQGVDYYIDQGNGQIIVATMEAESDQFDDQLDDFQQFINTLDTPSIEGGSE